MKVALSYSKLFAHLEEIKDPRRSQGQRTTKSQLLQMIILSNLCGHFGGRGISRFAKLHQCTFEQELKLKHGVPSHVTFSDFLNRVDEQEMIRAFNNWTASCIILQEGAILSGDGKALGSTVSNTQYKSQSFQAIVSLFCQKTGLVYAIDTYRNTKKSEINVVEFLIKELKKMGLTIYLDALHCQKKR